jgi:hypothetical protein
MIKQRGSIMAAIFDFLYREYCRARLAEMRKQLFWSQLRIQKRIATSAMWAPLVEVATLATRYTKLGTLIEPAVMA